MSVAADDSDSGIASGYKFSLWSNSRTFTEDAGDIPHGAPFNSSFTNWIQRSFPAELTPGVTYLVTLDNTTPTSPDFLAIDWIEVRVTTQ